MCKVWYKGNQLDKKEVSKTQRTKRENQSKLGHTLTRGTSLVHSQRTEETNLAHEGRQGC